MLQDIEGIIDTINRIQSTPLYKFLAYIQEKNPEDRAFTHVRKEFPEILENLDHLEYLISHELIWVEMNGTVRPGKVGDYLYSVVSKISKWKKQ
jgi:hypothetical protein